MSEQASSREFSGARPLPKGFGATVSSRGAIRALANVGRACAILAAAWGLLAIRNPTSTGQYAAGFALCAVAAAATLGLRRDAAWMVAYLIAFAVFAYLRAMADEVGIAPKLDYVLSLERALPGPLPTVWLQDHLWNDRVAALDVSMAGVHASYFVVPHAMALAVWRWRPAHTRRYVIAMLLTFYAGLVFAAAIPTVPPWMASESGLIPDVAKVNDWVYGAASVNGYTTDVVRMNPVAAMPSLHFAMTAVAVLGIWQFGRLARIAGVAYLALMGFALVYLGEHWVVDLLAGALLALAAWWAAAALTRQLARRWPPPQQEQGADR